MMGSRDRMTISEQQLKVAVCASTYFALYGTQPGVEELVSELGFLYYDAIMDYRAVHAAGRIRNVSA